MNAMAQWVAKEIMEKQIAEIKGEVNRYYTAQNRGYQREATEEELAWNYISMGGADDFRKRYPVFVA